MIRKATGWIGILASAMLAFAPVEAKAGIVNIGNGVGGSDPTGTSCPPCDPVLVQKGSDISIDIQGSASVTNEVLLGILIPNNTTNFFGGTDPLGTINTYNETFPTGASTGTGTSAFTGTGFGLGSGTGTYQGNGFWGDFASTPGSPKLSAFLDSNFNSSLNGPNFNAFDAGLGVPALASVTEFGVYTIAITTGSLAPNKGLDGGVDIQIPHGLPQGTILVALDDNSDSTVWTNSGGVDASGSGTSGDPGPDSVPEPSAILVLGSGLLGLGFIMWRRGD